MRGLVAIVTRHVAFAQLYGMNAAPGSTLYALAHQPPIRRAAQDRVGRPAIPRRPQLPDSSQRPMGEEAAGGEQDDSGQAVAELAGQPLTRCKRRIGC